MQTKQATLIEAAEIINCDFHELAFNMEEHGEHETDTHRVEWVGNKELVVVTTLLTDDEKLKAANKHIQETVTSIAENIAYIDKLLKSDPDGTGLNARLVLAGERAGLRLALRILLREA